MENSLGAAGVKAMVKTGEKYRDYKKITRGVLMVMEIFCILTI